MKLTHLGAFSTPARTNMETVETDTELRFLGRNFKMRTHSAAAPTFPEGYLTYRGVRYKT